MSGHSTPKRQLELGNDDSQNAENLFSLKRYRAEAYLSSLSRCPPSSPASYGTAQSFISLNDSTQRMAIDNDVDSDHSKDQFLPVVPVPEANKSALSSQHSFQLFEHQPDVQMQGIEQEEEVCFGMVDLLRLLIVRHFTADMSQLKSIPIQITKIQDTTSITFEDVGRVMGIFAGLSLEFEDDRCLVQAEGGVSVATLNRKTHLALNSLSSAKSLRYQGVVRRSEFEQKLTAITQPVGHNPQNLTTLMAILMFGVRSIGALLAKELSRRRLFLQHPHPMPQYFSYENPQYLTLVASSLPNGAVLPPISVPNFQRDGEAHFGTQELDDGADDVIAIMNNLPRQEYLSEADIDERVITQLLSHQREAVDFALHREATEGSKSGSLWRPEGLKLESPVYSHIITGSKSPVANDPRGGILADDMGLGKTLSMIATIVSTITSAENHPLGKQKNYDEKEASLIPCKSTLVIVPSVQSLVLLDGWIDEIEKHVTPGFLKYYKYHGPDRKLELSSRLPYHIVFSTYGTVTSDLRHGGGVLNCFHWYRLILDEAHAVRNWSTRQFKAVTTISATIRWCMTGTPIQDSLDDLESLIRFLRIPILEDPATFRKHIANARKQGTTMPTTSIPTPDFKNLKLLLGSICLRRSMTTLPSLGVTFSEHRPRLSEAERRAYERLASVCKDAIAVVVSKRRVQRGNMAILTALLKMRIFCNLGLRMQVSSDSGHLSHPDEVISLLQQSGEAVCAECKAEILTLDRGYSLDSLGLVDRGHLLCPECAVDGTGHSEGLASSILETDVDHQKTYARTLDADSPSGSGSPSGSPGRNAYPSKIMTLLTDIKEHYSQDKSIVFSFWRRSLDLVCQLLKEEGIVFGRVDGNIHPSQRKKVLAQFHDDPSTRVLLMTLGTGAVGLNNLSVASRVHILEPQWNPSVESQAIGRVLRLGQEKRVYVVRYITERTIEESVESRQMMKMQLALKGVTHTSDKGSSGDILQRIDRLRALGKIVNSSILARGAPKV